MAQSLLLCIQLMETKEDILVLERGDMDKLTAELLCDLVYIVERAKKCLDFSATLYIIHLLICIVYGGWPSSLTWWVMNIFGFGVMALLGEYLCVRRKLKEIPIRF